MLVCVTGASGYIGSALLEHLVRRDVEILALARSRSLCHLDCPTVTWRYCHLESEPLDHKVLEGVDAVIHLAGRAHTLEREDASSINLSRRINIEGSANVLKASVAAGVQRFIFMSTIGVYGPVHDAGEPLTEESRVKPKGPYAVSKYAAEEKLHRIAAESSIELVIVRPALVVGRGAPGNLKRLTRYVSSGLPMPVPSEGNGRAYVCLANCLDLLVLCVESPLRPLETFVVAEQDSPSTQQIMQWIAEGLDLPSRTVMIPGRVLQLTAKAVGKESTYRKLYGSYQVDASKAHGVLGWRPAQTLREAFTELGASYRAILDR